MESVLRCFRSSVCLTFLSAWHVCIYATDAHPVLGSLRTLKVVWMASVLRWSRLAMSSRIFSSPRAFSRCRVARSARCSWKLVNWSRAFWLTCLPACPVVSHETQVF